MIAEFVKAWDERKQDVRGVFEKEHPGSYTDIVKAVVWILPDLDLDRIVRIDHGDYQGTILFVIGEEGYQPSDYWYVKVNYGSCSACDTMACIQDSMPSKDDGTPSEAQVDDYMQLALHVLQGLKKLD